MFNGLGTDPVSSNWYVLYSIWLSLHFDAGGANRCTLTAPSKEGLASQKLCRRRELPPVWVEQGGIEFKPVLQLKLDGLRWGGESGESPLLFSSARRRMPSLSSPTHHSLNIGSVFYKRVTQKGICCRTAYLWMVQLYVNGARRRPRCVASTHDVARVSLRHYCATLCASLWRSPTDELDLRRLPSQASARHPQGNLQPAVPTPSCFFSFLACLDSLLLLPGCGSN
jgi:hypothetical protein